MSEQDKVDQMLISYFPGLCRLLREQSLGLNALIGDLGEEQMKQVAEALDDSEFGSVVAILWMQNKEGQTAPAFLMNQSSAVLDDLLEWCSQRPAEWFSLQHYKEGQDYIVALMPDLQKSAKRNEFQRLVEADLDPFSGELSMLFRPISICVFGGNNIVALDRMPEGRVSVGFAPFEEFKQDQPDKFPFEEIRWIDDIPVVRDGCYQPYLQARLQDTKKEAAEKIEEG